MALLAVPRAVVAASSVEPRDSRVAAPVEKQLEVVVAPAAVESHVSTVSD